MNDSIGATAAALDRLRPKLLSVAYRMLGSIADAEDAVQDAFLRLQQTTNVASPEAWLVKTTTRLCIDRLRQMKRREQYHGAWLPEPVSQTWDGAGDDRLELAESLSMAFLVLLETLTPAERAAYLLREVFNYEYEEIAELLEMSAANVRQLVSRSKKRLDQHERRFPAPAERADDLAERFFDACRSGDVSRIEAFLAQDVVLYADGGGKAPAAPKPVAGVHRVANILEVGFRKRMQTPGGKMTVEMVNGKPGVVFTLEGVPKHIFTFAESAGRVHTIYVMLNPEKMERWPKDST